MSAALDVEAERAATPGCAHVAHLNNAGAALQTGATLEAMVSHLALEAERGGYEAAAAVADKLVGLRSSLASLLGAQPDEVEVTGSDTQSWTKALWGFVLAGGVVAGQRFLVDRISYDSHFLGLLQVCDFVGATIEVIPSKEDGSCDIEALRTALDSDGVALVSITHVGTHRGLVNPVAEAGAACRAAGVPFFLDACQSIGQLPVDVMAIGCDVATGTGRKWIRGPRGTGILFVRSGFAERMHPPGIGGSSAVWEDSQHFSYRSGAARFSDFEVPYAAHLGLAVAVDHALDLGVDVIAKRVDALGERLRGALSAIDGCAVHDGGSRRSGIVTFTLDTTPPTDVASAARVAGINLSVSESHGALLDMGGARPASVVRASPHYFNTEAELDRLVEVVDLASRR
jgi:cysteine desulfurase/selenocysteine lyase